MNYIHNIKNFAEETKQALEKSGKTSKDILWIGCKNFSIPVDEFWKIADFSYDAGYGAQCINAGLVIMLNDRTWLFRKEYDGSEQWELASIPEKAIQTRNDAHSLLKDGTICYHSLMPANEVKDGTR